MSSTEEKIAIMQAFVNGVKVQYLSINSNASWEPSLNPSWNWARYNYRIAPEKVWVNIYKSTDNWYSSVFISRESADRFAGPGRKACVEVEI